MKKVRKKKKAGRTSSVCLYVWTFVRKKEEKKKMMRGSAKVGDVNIHLREKKKAEEEEHKQSSLDLHRLALLSLLSI